MKLFGKICLIISLVLIGISALCFGIGIAMGSSIKEVQTIADEGGFDFGSWTIGNGNFYFGPGEDKLAARNFMFLGNEVEKFEVDIQYGEISFVDSETEEIMIHIDAPERNRYSCKLDGSVLELKDKTKGYKVNWDGNDVHIEIEIPKGKTFDVVSIKTDAGVVNATHAFASKKVEMDLGAGDFFAETILAEDLLEANVGAGKIEIANFTTDDLELDCGVGNVTLTGRIEEEANANCGVGNITLVVIGNENDYNYEVDCGIGEVNINGNTFSGLSDKQHIDNNADKDMYLDCGVGKIELKMMELGGV